MPIVGKGGRRNREMPHAQFVCAHALVPLYSSYFSDTCLLQ
jgi:hypothetical protein